MLVRLLLLCHVLLASYPARAEPFDLSQREKIQLVLEDDPRDLWRYTTEIIRRGPEGQERLWVRAIWAQSKIPSEFGAKTFNEGDRSRALALAQKEGLDRESLELRLDALLLTLIDGHTKGESEGDVKESFLKLRREAQNKGLIVTEANIIRQLAFVLYERGEIRQSIDLQNEAAALLNQTHEETLIDTLRLKIDMALVLDTEGQTQRARLLYLDIENVCRKVQIRALCVTNYHEMGLHYTTSQLRDEWLMAEKYFLQAQKMAVDFRDPWTIAKTHAALGRLYTKLGRHIEAVEHAEKALKMFQTFPKPVWVADAYKKLGEALTGAQRYREALAPLLTARKLFADDFLLDQKEIAWLLAEAYEKLGEPVAALTNYRRYLSLHEQLSAEKSGRDYNQAMVNLGLKVEEERNKFLQAENLLQQQKLQDAERTRWLLTMSLTLAGLALGSMALVRYRTRQVREGEIQMRRILENIREGILTFDSSLRIQAGYSLYLEDIFGSQLLGRNLLDTLFAQTSYTDDERRLLTEVLHLILSEDEWSWEFNRHQLPNELIVTGKVLLTLEWQLIRNRQGRPTAILLILRDITDQRRLEAKIEEERLKSDQIARVLQEYMHIGSKRFNQVLREVRGFTELAQQWIDQAERPQLFRRLHTIKGLARTFGLRALAQSAHAFETSVQDGRSGRESLQEAFERFLSVFQAYAQLESKTVEGRAVAPATQGGLLTVMDTLLPELKSRTQELKLEFRGVQARDSVCIWPSGLLSRLEPLLVHAMNNALDHGYAFPRDRGAKVSGVFIEIEAEQQGDWIHLFIRDNGYGLAQDQLRAKAQKLGLTFTQDQQLHDLVFAEGLSTAEQTTETSGRGMGMAAMRELCQQLKGRISLRPSDRGQGAMVCIDLPIQDAGELPQAG